MPAKAAQSKEGRYSLQDKFVGYDARTDKTMLPPNTLISPSKNVLIGTSGRIKTVPGYTLDGGSSAVIDSGILSNFDFKTSATGSVRNMRAGFLTSAGNDGKLQYRYKDTAGTVSWITLMSSLTTVRFSFCEYFDGTVAQGGSGELKKLVLFVDGSNNVYSWNGGVTTFASATATTLTKQGTTTWAQAGFNFTGNKTVVINGVSATYTGGETTTTLTGVSVDFSATAVATPIHQAVVTTGLGSITALPATFGPTVIGCGRKNQVYYGSNVSNNLYISKQGNYKDCTVTTPVRLVGEGALIFLNDPPTRFIPQEVHGNDTAYDMYISEGKDSWAIIRATVSSDNTSELLEHIVLKTSPLQGAMSERFATKMKNFIMFLGNDKVAGFLGYMSYQYVPVITDFSYPIIDDMNSYDFTDGSIFYHKNYAYVAIPRESIIRVYNMTDQTNEQYSAYSPIESVGPQEPFFWEAPISYPIAGFYITEDGELGGHGYSSSESYLLFTGGSFNGQNINANATFAFDDKGDRTQSKGSNELWVEGYIKQNTTLSCTVTGDLDSFANSQTKTIDGSDGDIVAFGAGSGAIGKNPLGSNPLGGTSILSSALPAWFHVVKTYPQVPFYLEQLSFESNGVDLQWELLDFGTNGSFTTEGNNAITQ